jgi:hypothetical protein
MGRNTGGKRMTREEKIEKVVEILRDHYAVYLYEAAEAIVNALTEPDVGMWGKFWDDYEDECVFGELLRTDSTDYPYWMMVGDFKNFKPILGLKEFIEEADGISDTKAARRGR